MRVVFSEAVNGNYIVFKSVYDINKKINNEDVDLGNAQGTGQQIEDDLWGGFGGSAVSPGHFG